MTRQTPSFPGESAEYRARREELLEAEARLRAQIEEVAELRRGLPPGGAVAADYRFDELTGEGERRSVRMSELFTRGRSGLAIYSFMFGPEMKAACPMCTSMLDGLDGLARHIAERLDFVVVAKSPIGRIAEFAAGRGWRGLRLLSAHGNSYNADYQGEDQNGNQLPMLNVFNRSDDGTIRHWWASELLYVPFASGEPRHVDLLWPLWNLLDLTPEGRGADWHPQLSYDPAG